MRLFSIGCAAIAFCCWPPACSLGFDTPRTADEILAEIGAIKAGKPDPKLRDDPAARQEFAQKGLDLQSRRDDLIWELYKAHPDHEQVPKLLGLRWMHRMRDPKTAEAAMAEIDAVLAQCEGRKLGADVAFLKAEAVLRKNVNKPAAEMLKATMPAIEDAIRRAPQDPRGAVLLFAILQRGSGLSQGTRDELEKRVLRDYPESTHAKLIGTQKRQREALGKPFELQFTDAVSGAEVSITTLRGKIVVVSFWATWCGPCVAEMPRMKELYAQYHERGVEFIGVSLDVPEEEGGLARLKQFVQKNQIPWPQYYQGGVGENTFSATWGVNEIPAVFVIDADGKLASAEAKDKLGQLIPAMLARKGVGSQ